MDIATTVISQICIRTSARLPRRCHKRGFHLSSTSSNMYMSSLGVGVTSAVVAAVAGALYLWRSRNSEPKDSSAPKGARRHRRTWSFTSVGMIKGAFPEQAAVPEPIMNVAVYYDDNNCPTKEDVVQHLVRPMLEYERLSTIPNPDTSFSRPPTRTIDPFDLVRIEVVAGDNQVTTNAIMKHLHDSFTERLSELPWWEILIIENKGLGQSAVVLRMHHCLADGYSLVNIFEKIVTYEDGTPLVSRMSSMPTTTTINTSNTLPKPKPSFSLWSFLREAIHVITLSASKYDDDIAFSKHNRSGTSNGTTGSRTKKLMKHSGNRSCVLFPPVPLDFIKKLKSAAGVTVNDIIMVAVSQAIHDYCKSQDCPVLASSNNSIQCRALMPVALPRPQSELNDKSLALRNTWCLVSTDMGVGCNDILERLDFIHNKMNEIKSTPRAFVQLWIQNTLPPLLPVSMARQTVYDVFSRHSLVLTNVPGPDHPCLIAGKVGTSVQMFLSNLLPQISFLSYGGQIIGNMVMDPNELPESNRIPELYAAALVQLAERLELPVPLELVAFVKQHA